MFYPNGFFVKFLYKNLIVLLIVSMLFPMNATENFSNLNITFTS